MWYRLGGFRRIDASGHLLVMDVQGSIPTQAYEMKADVCILTVVSNLDIHRDELKSSVLWLSHRPIEGVHGPPVEGEEAEHERCSRGCATGSTFCPPWSTPGPATV